MDVVAIKMEICHVPLSFFVEIRKMIVQLPLYLSTYSTFKKNNFNSQIWEKKNWKKSMNFYPNLSQIKNKYIARHITLTGFDHIKFEIKINE
jgi:hypothetical protein